MRQIAFFFRQENTRRNRRPQRKMGHPQIAFVTRRTSRRAKQRRENVGADALLLLRHLHEIGYVEARADAEAVQRHGPHPDPLPEGEGTSGRVPMRALIPTPSNNETRFVAAGITGVGGLLKNRNHRSLRLRASLFYAVGRALHIEVGWGNSGARNCVDRDVPAKAYVGIRREAFHMRAPNSGYRAYFISHATQLINGSTTS